MKTIKIYSPSRSRHNTSISHKLFSECDFTYVIDESEGKNYEHLGVPLTLIPKEAGVNNIARARNWILQNKTTDYVLMVDDDMSAINFLHKRRLMKRTTIEIRALVENGFRMASDIGAGLWGINCQSDPRFYKINSPFSFSLIVLGTFCGILDTSISYDESITLKEDYDFYLQQLRKHRKVLRMDMFNYLVDHQKLAGGCQIYRNEEEERRQFDLLQKKWGSDIVKRNYRNEGSYNPIIHRPI